MFSLLTGTPPCPCCAYAHASSVLGFFSSSDLDSPSTRKSYAVETAAKQALPPELHIDGVTVVDPRDGKKSAGMTVIMKDGRITGVIPTVRKQATTDALIVDAAGKFVVPGYNDMHSHVLELADPSGSLLLMLADGVTGFRQMSGSPALLAKKRAGTLPIGKEAPQLLESPGSILTPFNAGTPEAVKAEIRRQKDQGADFLKMGLVNPDVFFAALEEGKRVGIPILGHLQEGTDALQATAAGFRSIEHLGPGSTVWISCSAAEDELRADSHRRQFIKTPPFKIPFLERIVMKRLQKLLVNPAAFANEKDVDRLGRAINTFSQDKGEQVAKRFVADRSWQCPTLVRLRTQEYADSPEYERDEMLNYLPAKSIQRWREVTAKFKALPAQTLATYRGAYPRQLGLAKLLSDTGVRMITGTDGGSYLGPGLTLKQEFKELADAGISPLKILQMTTVNAAEYLGRGTTMGTVESGREADLVVLDADPLARVENLHSISAVVRAGFHYSRRELDALKSRVSRTHGSLH